MFNANFNSLFAQQGWRCPVCGRVYSPITVMCFYCGNNLDAVAANETGKPSTTVKEFYDEKN
jgi:uncharacterized OB-fold protein